MVKFNVFLVLFFMMASPVFAQIEGEERTISGTVTDIDWVTSSLSVRYFDRYTGSMDEVAIRVTKETKITRGTKTISCSDIRQSDRVSITFYSDDLSGFKAKRISDQNQGNR